MEMSIGNFAGYSIAILVLGYCIGGIARFYIYRRKERWHDKKQH